MSLSWKAKRRGKTFCAPACGAGCTHKAYLEARRKAREMLKMLSNPKGWKIRVWENFGWHYELVKGGMTLHRLGDTYWTLFSSTEPGGGEMYWSPANQRFDTPDEAIANQLKLAIAHIKKCNKAVERVLR